MAKRKLSEVFVEFIEPALKYFGDPKPRTVPHDAACALGHVVWNAVVLDEVDESIKHLVAAKNQGGNIPEINNLIDLLAARKRSEFASDKRIIGVYDIRKKKDGSFALWAQASEPIAVLH